MVRTKIRKPLVWVVRRFQGRKIGKRVICMHSVKEKIKFEKRLVWLLRRWAVVPLNALSTADESIATVSLTFDDGSETWFENVLPVLAEYGVHATFFVNDENMASRLESHEFHHLIEVGGHTKDHVDLGRIVAKQVLSRQIQERRFFAYPWGTPSNINPTVVNYLACSYRVQQAFTCIPGWYPRHDYVQPRDSLDLDDPEWFWEARLKGAYDWLYGVRHNLRRIFK